MHSQPPLVSIIIPCYNHEAYVQDSIESVLSQDYSNKEVILIDDGSKDSTALIIKRYKHLDNVTVYCKENEGIPKTLNLGLQLSRGSYLIIFASDDVMIPGRIKAQVEWLEKNPSFALCSGKVKGITADNKKFTLEPKAFDSGYIFEDLIFMKYYIMTPTVMIRSSIFKSIGNYDTSLKFEDADMWLRIAKVYPIGYIPKYFAYYRSHTFNYHKSIDFLYDEVLKSIEKHKDFKGYWKAKKNLYSLAFLNKSVKTKNKIKAIRYFINSLPFIHINSIKGIIKLIFIWK